jgi:rubrerythrin
MSIKDEETGMVFYKALAEKTDIEALKNGFNEIAEQERHHAAIFQDMLASLKDIKTREQYEGQYEAFVNALLETRAFPSPEKAKQMAFKINTREGIDIAMRIEKDTLLFYEEMNKIIPQTHTKYINDIIEEERYHLTQLTELKKRL